MRYERKFRVDALEHSALEQLILLHPAAFTKAFPDRRVNNIYWDTAHLGHAQDNISGVALRTKIRVRWYGMISDKLEKPVLEIKSRSNMQGSKMLIPLPDCSWQGVPELVEKQLQMTFPGKIFQAVLVNSYQRSYYLSMDGRFRLTIDRDMVYGPWLPWHFETPIEDVGSVIELKYDAPEDAGAEEIARYLGLRMTKHSKYSRGISLVYSAPAI